MSKPVSMGTMPAAPSSAKGMRLSIQVQNNTFIKVDDKSIPVVYGTLENPAVIFAKVTLEADNECAGDSLEVLYTASATYRSPAMTGFTNHVKCEHSFQKKRWTIDLNKPKVGKVAAGKYEKLVTATIDPLWPSSGSTVPHMKGYGWIRYQFVASFTKISAVAPYTILSDSKEVWVMNSTLPSSTESKSGQGSPLYQQPFSVQAAWKKSTLPVSLTIPSDTLSMAQIVPITVKMNPFNKGTKNYGKAIIISEAHFALREKVIGRGNAMPETFINTRDIITVPIKDGWPEIVGPWERTVNLTMPMSPSVVASMKSKYMDVSHSLVLVMKIKADDKKSKTEEFEIQAPVHIVAPRPTAGNDGDILPIYSHPGVGSNSTQGNYYDQVPQY
ncbi:hypothetical protein BGX27_009829 [Mortierella sp. AM989]|nr:hypothetical protein BGX27_009829 [Mortierella sp. AM989]